VIADPRRAHHQAPRSRRPTPRLFVATPIAPRTGRRPAASVPQLVPRIL